MIDSLCDHAGEQNATVACFYFDFADQKDQSPANTMGALLKQVVCGLEEIPEEISQEYQKQKKAIGGRGLRLSEIVKMLQTTSARERTFICIDAIDECVPEYRVRLLDSLSKILQKSPGTRIFVTGRPHIRPEIGRRLAGRVTSLPISTKRDDIIRYLCSRLEDDSTPDAMDGSLEAEILMKIPEDISEMYVGAATLGKAPRASTNRYLSRFLLVSLNIDAILQEPTIHLRREKLNAMTDGLGLGDAYGATLDRINRQGGEKARFGMAALMWISHTERPLKADELCHALAVEIGSPDLNMDNVPSIGTLLACCQGLIVVDKEASTARLVHFTLQEYLRAHPDIFGAAHSAMAETCLIYLNTQQVKTFATSPSSNLQHTPFLEYSSLYWGVHAKRDLSDCAEELALSLFEDYCHHISIKILLKTQKMYWYAVDLDKPSLFSGLHCASFFGIIEIVVGLAGIEGCDINQMDFTGNTPLHWASWNGHEEVVTTLLGWDSISPEKPDKCGRTPLHHASGRGYKGVVKILLGREGVNPDKPDGNDRTPLWWAAANGCQGVVEMLLERNGVNPDKPDKYGETPLYGAAQNGHEEVVKMLLKRDGANPDTPNMSGRTPLLIAACYGHEGVVKILLGQGDVNPDKPERNGRTPLWWAARDGHEEVVKILVERDDVNPDKPDNNGRTPLSSAAERGREGVVRMLLGQGGINPDKPNTNGRTPLHWAADRGHEGVVKILLERDDVNPNKPDNTGRTPLWRAAYSGHEGVVKILLERDDVNSDKLDNDGQSPLWRAAYSGHEGVVEILLARDDVNPHKPDSIDRTPLFIAACFGHEGVVKMLLALGVSPDTPNINGRTPLYHAAWNGHEGVVKVLLTRDDVNPNKLDKDGKTPLDRATEEGHKGVIALLQPPETVAPSLS